MQATVRIKGYDGIEQVALGRRSVVFSARSRRHKCEVAIKLLLPHLAGEPRFVTRFARDVKVASQVRHRNIVNVLDFGRTESSYYVVVEHYEGCPLSEVLAEHPRMPIPTALSIVLQVAEALEAAHARDLVHRDVRPANIILARDGLVKLTNFSLATDIGENGRVTHAGKVTATPAYMSPEQSRGETLQPATDLFSLGCVAYELLAGARAFGKGDFGEILDRIQSGQSPNVGEVNPVIEAPFVRMVAKLLSPDAGGRYAHVSELVMDLEEAMEKYGYANDRQSMKDYLADPAGYTDACTAALLGRITARTPVGGSATDAALFRYYEKVVFLDPGDDGARKELARLRREGRTPTRRSARRGAAGVEMLDDSPAVRFASLDPNAEYRVILESIDGSLVNEASFALKLSMKIRTPLPRIQSLVKNMPSRVTDRVSYRRAMHLAKTIESLGGRVRLDVSGSGNAAAAPSQSPGATVRESSASASGGVTCPKCGNVESEGATFCSICLERFSRQRIDARLLRERGTVEDNPLAETPQPRSVAIEYLDRVNSLPASVKVTGAIILVGLALQLLLR